MKRLLSKDHNNSGSKLQMDDSFDNLIKSSLNQENIDLSKIRETVDKIGDSLESSDRLDRELISFLNKGDVDLRSRKSLKFVKQLFGEKHVECRDIIRKLEALHAKKGISVTEEEAIKLSKRPKAI